MNREEYEKDLKNRQQEHLERVRKFDPFWQPCLHDQCPECIGTGIRHDGSSCIHFIHCTCPKCSPYCISSGAGTGTYTADPDYINKFLTNSNSAAIS